MVKNIVAVFVFKKKTNGKPWAYVADFDNEQKFKEWFDGRRALYSHIARSEEGDFHNIQEVDEFKAWLKGLLCIGPTPDLSDEKFDYYDRLNDDMIHYNENEFDKV